MKLPKFLRLPTPKETGKSDSNSLQMEDFGAEPESYTWECYETEMKQEYPVRYFINKYVPRIFRRYILTPLETLKYWVVSHTIRKYHLLDLRNNNYDYGWCDADQQLLFATMKILENFIIEQNTEEGLIKAQEALEKDPEEKELNWSFIIKNCEELLEIQKWWREEYPKYDWDFKNKEKNYEKETEMIKKVIDLRAGMWT